MKVAGAREIGMALSRIRRLRALGRVGGVDEKFIADRLEEIQARIVGMSEVDESGEEVRADG
jgi:hypothetical protein